MSGVTVVHGQSMFDLALQCSGTVEAAFAMSELNDTAVTEHLADGASLACAPVESRRVVAFYERNTLTAATDTDISYGQPALSWSNQAGWGNRRIW